MPQDALELQFRELRDQILNANREIEELKKQLNTIAREKEDLLKEKNNLQEQVDYLKKKLFGASSEKRSGELEGQLRFLINEAEVLCDIVESLPAEEEPEEDLICDTSETNPSKPRQKRKTFEEALKGKPFTKRYVDLPEDKKVCPECGTPYKRIGEEYLRTEYDIIPPRIKIIKWYSITYQCPKCSGNGIVPELIRSRDGQYHMLHGMASASTVAWAAYQKFCQGVPLYRQEKDWEQMGAPVGRATLSNWLIKNAREFFTPMFDYFHRQLLKRSFVMADETPLQVLNEKDKKPQSRSYMWVFRSGEDEGPPIVLYRYYKTRAGANAKEFLNGFNGYLMTDGYTGYNVVPDVTRTACWAHVRRYLVEAIPRGKEYDYSVPAVQGTAYVNKLFMIERDIRSGHLTADEIKEKRLQKEKPVLEGLWSWLEKQNPEKGTRFDKAVTYIRNRQNHLENYLLDGHCSFSNNASERAVKQVVIGRKNWLFAVVPSGAEASALIYTMVEMARANGVNVYQYLTYLLEKCPTSQTSDEELEKLAPWDPEVKRITGERSEALQAE